MTKRLELKGQRFNRLLVIKYLGPYKANMNSEPKALWECKCDCEEIVQVVRGSLISGLTQSCGCLNREKARERKLKHGKSYSSLYRTWVHIIGRCENKNDESYKNYGGRGINICKEWREDFEAFEKYIGEKPSDKYSIDRIDNEGNYEPGNVRWATIFVQANNRRKQKRKTHCKRGHEFTKENIYWVITKDGKHRSCRACRRLSEERRQLKNRGKNV